jgi:hypothetical protein
MERLTGFFAVAAVVAFAAAAPVAVAQEGEGEGNERAPGAGSGCDPSFGGKYTGLLRRIRVPGDVQQYGRCRDYGRWSGYSYRGYTNLPNGYWTYSAPHWYIWANQAQ